jgi:hypothetical protein
MSVANYAPPTSLKWGQKMMYTRAVPFTPTDFAASSEWYLSEKLDGWRMQWTGLELYGKNAKLKCPPAWLDELKRFAGSHLQLDGELYAGRGKFSQIQKLVKTTDWRGLSFQVFDVLGTNDVFSKRLVTLAQLKASREVPDFIHFVQHESIPNSMKVVDTHFNHIVNGGGEGVVLRAAGMRITPGAFNHGMLKKKFMPIRRLRLYDALRKKDGGGTCLFIGVDSEDKPRLDTTERMRYQYITVSNANVADRWNMARGMTYDVSEHGTHGGELAFKGINLAIYLECDVNDVVDEPARLLLFKVTRFHAYHNPLVHAKLVDSKADLSILPHLKWCKPGVVVSRVCLALVQLLPFYLLKEVAHSDTIQDVVRNLEFASHVLQRQIAELEKLQDVTPDVQFVMDAEVKKLVRRLRETIASKPVAAAAKKRFEDDCRFFTFLQYRKCRHALNVLPITAFANAGCLLPAKCAYEKAVKGGYAFAPTEQPRNQDIQVVLPMLLYDCCFAYATLTDLQYIFSKRISVGKPSEDRSARLAQSFWDVDFGDMMQSLPDRVEREQALYALAYVAANIDMSDGQLGRIIERSDMTDITAGLRRPEDEIGHSNFIQYSSDDILAELDAQSSSSSSSSASAPPPKPTQRPIVVIEPDSPSLPDDMIESDAADDSGVHYEISNEFDASLSNTYEAITADSYEAEAESYEFAEPTIQNAQSPNHFYDYDLHQPETPPTPEVPHIAEEDEATQLDEPVVVVEPDHEATQPVDNSDPAGIIILDDSDDDDDDDEVQVISASTPAKRKPSDADEDADKRPKRSESEQIVEDEVDRWFNL